MTSDLHKDFTQGSISHMDFWNVTHKYVTLGSGGVGWATGYQYHQQTCPGHARNRQNGVRDTLDASLRVSPFFLRILRFEGPTKEILRQVNFGKIQKFSREKTAFFRKSKKKTFKKKRFQIFFL